jgi:hypothetical protein
LTHSEFIRPAVTPLWVTGSRPTQRSSSITGTIAAMSNTHRFTDGYLDGTEHRTCTDADRAAYGDWAAGDGYLRCPGRHPDPDPTCDWCQGWAAAWD